MGFIRAQLELAACHPGPSVEVSAQGFFLISFTTNTTHTVMNPVSPTNRARIPRHPVRLGIASPTSSIRRHRGPPVDAHSL